VHCSGWICSRLFLIRGLLDWVVCGVVLRRLEARAAGRVGAVLTGDSVFIFSSFCYGGGALLLVVAARRFSSSLASGRVGAASFVASSLCAPAPLRKLILSSGLCPPLLFLHTFSAFLLCWVR
jgi:hypothetical protein